MLRSKGIEMAIDRINSHKYRFAAVLPLGGTEVAGVSTLCNREVRGSALLRRLLRALQQGFCWEDQEFPRSTEKLHVPVSRCLFSWPVWAENHGSGTKQILQQGEARTPLSCSFRGVSFTSTEW